MNYKATISYLLFFCFSIFLGHNLIPHHHHSEAECVVPDDPCEGHVDDPCEGDAHDHHDSESPPIHCDAFNDLHFVGFNHSDVQEPVRTVLLFAISLEEPKLETLVSYQTQKYSFLKLPDKTIAHYGAISMRAPPFYS